MLIYCTEINLVTLLRRGTLRTTCATRKNGRWQTWTSWSGQDARGSTRWMDISKRWQQILGCFGARCPVAKAITRVSITSKQNQTHMKYIVGYQLIGLLKSSHPTLLTSWASMIKVYQQLIPMSNGSLTPWEAHERLLTPTEMLASLCLPTTGPQARASGSPKLQVESCTPAALAKAAGNGMSVPCMGAFLVACIMCVEPLQ